MKFGWQVKFAAALIAISIVFMVVHLLLFEDLHFLEKYMFFYLAFLPLEVLIVTMVLDGLMARRERQEKIEKMTMVIGVFFSEAGSGLLSAFARADPSIEEIRKELMVTGTWSDADFNRVRKMLNERKYSADIKKMDLPWLRGYLIERRAFMARLIENPVLLEHESFTDVIRAVFHLTEELDARKELDSLPASDYTHLSGDVTRAYKHLSLQWIDYMAYLKHHYPYLFSLAMRLNPFATEQSPIVR